MKKYVMQELLLFYLKTVVCAGSINKSSLNLPGNIILVFLCSELLDYMLQRIYEQLSSITKLPSWSMSTSLICMVRLGEYILNFSILEEPSVDSVCVCMRVCVFKQQKPCPPAPAKQYLTWNPKILNRYKWTWAWGRRIFLVCPSLTWTPPLSGSQALLWNLRAKPPIMLNPCI